MRVIERGARFVVLSPAVLLQFAATAIVLAALPYRGFSTQEYLLPKELVLHATAWTALIAVAARTTVFRITPTDLALAAFLVWSLVGSIRATDHWAAASSLADTASLAAVFWTARHVASDPADQRRMLAAMVFAAGVSALIGLAEAYGLVPRLAKPGLGPGGTLGNRSFLAYFALMTLPAAVWMSNTRGGTWLRNSALVVCGMSAALITLTRSRASWLATLVMMLAALGTWISMRAPRPAGPAQVRLALTGVSLVLGIVAAVFVPNRLSWSAASPYVESLRRLTDYSSGSGLQRVIEYRSTLRMIRGNPVLGVGPNNWQVEYPLFAADADPSYDPRALRSTPPLPASDWLGITAERGVPALLLLLVVAALLFREVNHARGEKDVEDVGILARRILLTSTLAGLAIVGGLDAVLMTPAAAYVAAVTLGSVAPHRYGTSLIVTQPVRVATVVVACVIGAAVIADSARRVVAVHLARVQWDVARLETAARWDPHHYELRMLLARHWIAEGGCERAIQHATIARSLRPFYPAPERLLRECDVSADSLTRISSRNLAVRTRRAKTTHPN